jgi:hypothetical protein
MPLCFTLPGYRRLYRSLLAYTPLSGTAAQGLIYLLNTANIDTCRERNPQGRYHEMDCPAFMRTLNRNAKPYRTPVQLYKSLEYLLSHISNDAVTQDQRDAVKMAKRVMADVAARFRKEYGAEIDGLETVYALYPLRLNPRFGSEPTSPLLS